MTDMTLNTERIAVQLMQLAKRWNDKADAEEGKPYNDAFAYRECAEDLDAVVATLLPEFECCWCRDHAELPPDEYTFPHRLLGGWCETTNRPICKECRWNAEDVE